MSRSNIRMSLSFMIPLKFRNFPGEVATVLSKLPDWVHCVISVEFSTVSHEDSNSMFKILHPGHIWVSVCVNIWLMVCIVLSNFQLVSVKIDKNYISVYNLTSCKVGVVRGSSVVTVKMLISIQSLFHIQVRHALDIVVSRAQLTRPQ